MGFDWGKFLKDHSYKAAPVSCFKHVSALEMRGGRAGTGSSTVPGWTLAPGENSGAAGRAVEAPLCLRPLSLRVNFLSRLQKPSYKPSVRVGAVPPLRASRFIIHITELCASCCLRASSEMLFFPICRVFP